MNDLRKSGQLFLGSAVKIEAGPDDLSEVVCYSIPM